VNTKRKTKRWMVFGWVVIALLALSACTIKIDRNKDGSLRAESDLPQETLQSEIELAIADPQVQELTADLHDGYISVTGIRKRVGSDETDKLTFRLTFGVEDGHLTATISDAKLNDIPIEQDRVQKWNERIAEGLEKGAKNRPNSTLQEVKVTEDAVTMVWRIETKRSRGE
jgi:hypothetical protein